jgi:proline iminopeptidase
MTVLFPDPPTTASGLLDVGDGHRVHWETFGSATGRPALILHGGPGAAPWTGARRWFDPVRWRIVSFDQRMAGRSTPSAADPMQPFVANTTHHLVADIERLREHLGVERWLVCGGSWGVTLALAYAERHPERVSEMVLVSITLTRRSDVHWLAHEAGRFFPDAWRRFAEHAVRASGSTGAERDLVAAYRHLLHEHPDPDVRRRAAAEWCAYEDAIVSLEEGWEPNPRYADPGFAMTFARTVTEYFHHAAWLGETELLDGVARLAGIPAVLVHGRLDISGPPDIAVELARRWPGAELHLVRTGHTGGDPMLAPVLAAIARFGTEPGG